MKALIVSLDNREFQAVQTVLLADDFDLMVLARSTGLFRKGNVSFVIVAQEERVDRALEQVRSSVASTSNSGIEVLIFNLEGHLRL